MKRHRVCIVDVALCSEGVGGILNTYKVRYKVLKRGDKPERWKYVSATDELDAYVRLLRYMGEQGYRV